MRNYVVLLPICCGALLFTPTAASAQARASSPFSSNTPPDPWSVPGKDQQVEFNKRRLGLGISLGGFVVPGRWEISNGGLLELEATYRIPIERRYRFEVGIEGRFVRTYDATHAGVGAPVRLVFGFNKYVEMDMSIALSYSRVVFDLPFFVSRNAFVAQARWGVGFLLSRSVSVGITPLGCSTMLGDRVEPFFVYEPLVWARFASL